MSSLSWGRRILRKAGIQKEPAEFTEWGLSLLAVRRVLMDSVEKPVPPHTCEENLSVIDFEGEPLSHCDVCGELLMVGDRPWERTGLPNDSDPAFREMLATRLRGIEQELRGKR